MEVFVVIFKDRHHDYMGIAGVFTTEEEAKKVHNELWRTQIVKKSVEDIYVSQKRKNADSKAEAKAWREAHDAGN